MCGDERKPTLCVQICIAYQTLPRGSSLLSTCILYADHRLCFLYPLAAAIVLLKDMETDNGKLIDKDTGKPVQVSLVTDKQGVVLRPEVRPRQISEGLALRCKVRVSIRV